MSKNISICNNCKLIIDDDTKAYVYVDGEDKEPKIYHISCFYENFSPLEKQGES